MSFLDTAVANLRALAAFLTGLSSVGPNHLETTIAKVSQVATDLAAGAQTVEPVVNAVVEAVDPSLAPAVEGVEGLVHAIDPQL